MLGLVLLLQGCGAMMLRVPCEKPRISNMTVPSSHVVLVPFRYRGDKPEPREAARALTEHTMLLALQGATRLPGTQVSVVEGDPADPRCDIEAVYDAITAAKHSGLLWRRPYHSAIFVWGEVYAAGDELVVQSRVRAFWNGAKDRAIQVHTHAPGGETFTFAAELPEDSIVFPPRRVRLETLHARQDGARVHEAPNPNTPSMALPRRFLAMTWQPPWLQVQGDRGEVGWVRLEDPAADAPTAPETLFTEALAAYLNARVSGSPGDRADAHALLATFREAAGKAMKASQATARDFRVPLAIAAVLEGTLGLADADAAVARGTAPADASTRALVQTVAQQRAQTELADARERMPANAAILNLAALARLATCCGTPPQRDQVVRIHTMLDQAAALEPGDLRILENLLTWHRFLATLPAEVLPFSPAELQARTRDAAFALEAWSRLAAGR